MVGAYLLGALDPAENRALTEHLVQCRVCRDEAFTHAPLVQLLAVTKGIDPAQWWPDIPGDTNKQ
jgi:hypothetical protein